jgi:branched-chain amino acid transport system permease protein
MSPARASAYFLQQLINGLALGAVFTLIAVGYSLVYGISGTIQFAFGEVFMIGAYLMVIMLAVSSALGLGFAPAVLLLTLAVGGLVTAVYGWSIERLVYRPLRGAGALTPLIAAIGLSIALREFVRIAQGAGNQWLPNLLPARFTVFDGGGFPVTLSGTQLAIFALALAASVALGAFATRTRLGRAQRACADDPAMAALLGVDVDRTIAIAFAQGAMLAALAGFVVALYYGEVDPNIGYLAGFKALTAALLGGFGSIAGALAGGLLLGLFETFWSGYFGGDYKDAAVFAVLILVLIFRPQGLFGAASRPREGDALFPIR